MECVYLFPEITSSFFRQRCVTLPPAVPWHWMSHYPSHAATFCCLHNAGHRSQQEASILLMFLHFLYHCRTHSSCVQLLWRVIARSWCSGYVKTPWNILPNKESLCSCCLPQTACNTKHHVFLLSPAVLQLQALVIFNLGEKNYNWYLTDIFEQLNFRNCTETYSKAFSAPFWKSIDEFKMRFIFR